MSPTLIYSCQTWSIFESHAFCYFFFFSKHVLNVREFRFRCQWFACSSFQFSLFTFMKPTEIRYRVENEEKKMFKYSRNQRLQFECIGFFGMCMTGFFSRSITIETIWIAESEPIVIWNGINCIIFSHLICYLLTFNILSSWSVYC